jgi:hypothetical protein
MDTPQTTLAEKLKAATYVLVTVSRDPSVDQLAALIGLTLLLNKAGKHAAAVYSGETPSTLQFLKPEDTIEKTTDSLRDFIIALDKSKADKLRYKVEDDVVRIFITPYKTSISKDDLEFSQGDFNVDVVVALGVINQEDLDEVIISHGRILHDATVATVNISSEGDLGSIHWQNPKASSLSEMMTELARLMGGDMIDNQIATALLTGIVAETDRFSNEKTTAEVMSASAILMAAGANQQLVATQLEQPPAQPQPKDDSNWNQSPDDAAEPTPEVADQTEEAPTVEKPQNEDGSIEIEHNAASTQSEQGLQDEPNIDEKADSIVIEPPEAPAKDYLNLPNLTEEEQAVEPKLEPEAEPPTLGGQLTANSQVEALEPSGDPLSARPSSGQETLLTRGEPMATMASMEPEVAADELVPAPTVEPIMPPEPQPAPLPAPMPKPAEPPHQMITGLTPPPPAWVTPLDNPLDLPVLTDPANQTLADLETAVHDTPASVDDARDEVLKALNSDASQPLEPVQALNAQPMFDGLHNPEPAPLVQPTQPAALPAMEPNAAFAETMQQQIPSLPLPPTAPSPVVDPASVAFNPAAFGISGEPGASIPGTPAVSNPAPQVIDPNAAPPVPPPIPFNFGTPQAPPQA